MQRAARRRCSRCLTCVGSGALQLQRRKTTRSDSPPRGTRRSTSNADIPFIRFFIKCVALLLV